MVALTRGRKHGNLTAALRQCFGLVTECVVIKAVDQEIALSREVR
jgi:hypothetical protein